MPGVIKKTFLANRDNFRQVVDELRYNFTIYVLESLGIPEEILDECFPEGGYDEFSVEHKKKLRSILRSFDVTIMDDRDGGTQIYLDRDLMAEWKKCNFKLKRDYSAIELADKVYVQINAEYWTIFDEESEDGE
jgi:hypothetical protein